MVTNGSGEDTPTVTKRVNYQIVMVEWLDAEGESAWKDVRHCSDHELTPVLTVGWLICENNKWIVMASTLHKRDEDDDQCSSIDFIPIGCILRRRTLWHPDTDQSWREMWDKPFDRPELL